MTLEYACEAFATTEDFFLCECDCVIDPENNTHMAFLAAALDAASDQLALMSAHSVRGICTQTVTTCIQRCSCRSSCSCELDVIRLPGPIVNVTNVEPTIPGEWDYVFDLTDFTLVDETGLAWAPGSTETWPTVMVDITYTFGATIDEIAKQAAIELACAAMKKCLADACTNLGPNPGSVSRQGITLVKQTVSALADSRAIAQGQYPWMAKFLSTYNPDGAFQKPWIWSPELGEVYVLRALAPVAP